MPQTPILFRDDLRYILPGSSRAPTRLSPSCPQWQTHCSWLFLLPRLPLLASPLLSPRVTSQMNSWKPHLCLSHSSIPYRSHCGHSDRGNQETRKEAGWRATLTSMFTVRHLWDPRDMTSANPAVAFCLYALLSTSPFGMLYGYNTALVFSLCSWLLLPISSVKLMMLTLGNGHIGSCGCIVHCCMFYTF